jgi:hypothetical protein
MAAFGLVTTLRNTRLDAITTAVGASGLIDLYDGTQPSTGGTATTLLAQLACSTTFAPGASGGVLSANGITADASANATGTATWGRLKTSGGTAVADFTAGTSGTSLILTTAAIVATQPVSINSFVVTEGNA